MDCTMCQKPIPETSKYRKTCSDNCRQGRWLLKTLQGSVRRFNKWAATNKVEGWVLVTMDPNLALGESKEKDAAKVAKASKAKAISELNKIAAEELS